MMTIPTRRVKKSDQGRSMLIKGKGQQQYVALLFSIVLA